MLLAMVFGPRPLTVGTDQGRFATHGTNTRGMEVIVGSGAVEAGSNNHHVVGIILAG